MSNTNGNDLHSIIKNTKKEVLIKYARQKCKHGHSILAHPNCYREMINQPERVGVLDIESEGVRDMQYERIKAYTIKVLHEDKFYQSRMTGKDVKNKTYDLNLVKQFVEDVKHFDKLITYCGVWHDLPALRTRVLYWNSKGHNIDFPLFQEVKHYDLYFTADKKLKLRNKKLMTICSLLGIECKKIFTTPEMAWASAAGCDKALAEIMAHSKEDTISTEQVHDKLCGYVGPRNTSI